MDYSNEQISSKARKLVEENKKQLISIILSAFPITGLLGMHFFITAQKKKGIIWIIIVSIIIIYSIIKNMSCKGSPYSCINSSFLPYIALGALYIIQLVYTIFQSIRYLIKNKSASNKSNARYILIVICIILIILLGAVIIWHITSKSAVTPYEPKNPNSTTIPFYF